MQEEAFNISLKALIAAFVFALLFFASWKWRERFQKPAILYSDVQSLKPKRRSIKQLLAVLPSGLMYAAIVFFLLAWIDPHFFSERMREDPMQNPTEGIAIYLVLDESGSMMEPITMQLPNGTRQTAPKIDLLKTITEPFIEKRPNDLLGLVSFARTAHIQAPLTLDHQEVVQKMLRLQPSILEQDGGTAIGYAIFKTAHLIVATRHFAEDLLKKGKPAYVIKNSVIVLVTDGVQTVNPRDADNDLRSMDIAESAAYAKENAIKLYIISVDPSVAKEALGPQRRLMQRSAESTGGKFYIVDGAHNLGTIYDDIDQIEKSQIPPTADKDYYRKASLYPYLIASGLACLLAGILLSTTLLRKTP